ncbi:Protein of unknown function [Gryllus bimaculatus]|nr:Protein of unknown function [Gryllus bimaculatus]
MALGVRARVGVGVGAVLGLSAAVAVVWFAASTANPSTVRYVNGSAPATAPPPPPENPAPGAGEEQEGERDAEAAPEPFSLPLRRSKRVPLDGERCAPGVTYMDECNTCICSMDGIKAHASCTFKFIFLRIERKLTFLIIFKPFIFNTLHFLKFILFRVASMTIFSFQLILEKIF